MRFEFKIGDLVECIIRDNTKNLSMHETRMAHLSIPDTIPAVVIGKKETDTARHFVYTIRRADGKVLTLRTGIYPIGHFKDEV